ncbi:phosphate signaling complex protein PhoU [Parasphingopyxis marina]|uniref:Phosphate-specific transport system accessory protein PhoU n=1 Tax=Parasphingopyxis marina TaxID=2761622 RepID=A0A842HWU9_9SPHN|nr:phosphate signaling complex protein PhoU [Parasphingopyxis marina]MBC2776759.1 phosphate signaling complex protein PhoU [Parasphingopyxis marina]
MNGDAKHTVTAFDDELEALRANILELGWRTSLAMTDAISALENRDQALARQVVTADRETDRLAAEVEAAAVNIIARRAPMADDLRVLVSAIKIAALLERTADYAKNIARRVPSITAKFPKKLRMVIGEMNDAAQAMLSDVVKAYAEADVALANEVCVRDDAVDDMHEALTAMLIEFMIESPDQISQAAHLLFVSKHLERIGDQATNIAEMVSYMATGEQPRIRDTGPDRLAA